jgi:hypothetical protein
MSKVNLDIAEKLNITCRKGDTFSLSLTIKDSEGTVVPLTTNEYSFLMQARGPKKADGTRDVIIDTTESVDTGFVIAVNNSGVVTITASATFMKTVDQGRYVYDLQQSVGIANTVVTTILEGSFVVNDDISRTNGAT